MHTVLERATTGTVDNIFHLINLGEGHQFTSPVFDFTNLIIPTAVEEDFIKVRPYSKRTKKKVPTYELTLLVFHLHGGGYLYFYPHYDIHKVNGSTHNSNLHPEYIMPKNAFDVYRLDLTYQGELSLKSLEVQVYKYPNF